MKIPTSQTLDSQEKIILGLLTGLHVIGLVGFFLIAKIWMLWAPLVVSVPISLWLGARSG